MYVCLHVCVHLCGGQECVLYAVCAYMCAFVGGMGNVCICMCCMCVCARVVLVCTHGHTEVRD